MVVLGCAISKPIVGTRRRGGELVLKLKKNWKARVVRIMRGQFIESKRRDWQRFDVWCSLDDYRFRSDVVDCKSRSTSTARGFRWFASCAGPKMNNVNKPC